MGSRVGRQALQGCFGAPPETIPALPEVQRARLDHFALDPYESRMVGAGEDNDSLAFQATLKNWERVSLEALRRIRGDAGEVSRGKGAA